MRIENPHPRPPAPEPFEGRIKPDGTRIPRPKPKAPKGKDENPKGEQP